MNKDSKSQGSSGKDSSFSRNLPQGGQTVDISKVDPRYLDDFRDREARRKRQEEEAKNRPSTSMSGSSSSKAGSSKTFGKS